jgi:hypothetical protein
MGNKIETTESAEGTEKKIGGENVEMARVLEGAL